MPNRKAFVEGIQSIGRLALSYWDSSLTRTPNIDPPAPFLGGVPIDQSGNPGTFSGVYSVPQTGSQVLVVHEGDRTVDKPASAVGMTDRPDQLPALAAGETIIQNASGAYIKLSASGVITMHCDSNLSLVLDPSTHRATFTATGGLWVGSTQVTVP